VLSHVVDTAKLIGRIIKQQGWALTLATLPFIPFFVGGVFTGPDGTGWQADSLALRALTVNATAFTFDTSNTKSINVFSNIDGDLNSKDECFIENRATVGNLGLTNANCHIVYIPLLPGTFGSINALQVEATASMVRNASGQGAGKLNATGELQSCRSITNFAQCWGTTTYAVDTGGGVGILIGQQVNVILQNPVASYTGAASNPSGFVATLLNAGQNGESGTAYTANGQSGSPARWNVAYLSTDSGASAWGQ